MRFALLSLMASVNVGLGAPVNPWPKGFCVGEETMEGTAKIYDNWWRTAQVVLDKGPATISRPHVCMAPYTLRPWGKPRAYAMWLPDSNAILVALSKEETRTKIVVDSRGAQEKMDFYDCTVIHEMIHALLRTNDEEAVVSLWKCIPPKGVSAGN